MRLAFAALVLVAGCAPAAPQPETAEQTQARLTAESADAKRAIDSLNADFEGHFNAGHGDLVAAQYAEDAVLAVSGGEPVKGRQAIAATVTGMAKDKAAIKLTAVTVAASGPLAVEWGSYSLNLQPAGAKGPITDNGSFLVHWHKVGGSWIRIHDVATTSVPPGPPPAPAKPK